MGKDNRGNSKKVREAMARAVQRIIASRLDQIAMLANAELPSAPLRRQVEALSTPALLGLLIHIEVLLEERFGGA